MLSVSGRLADQRKPVREAPVVYRITAAYPGGEPYGFAAPAGINFRGRAPGNTGSKINCPFEGAWHHFSWAPDGWSPAGDPRKGSNLLAWVRSIGHRLTEGA